MLCYVAVVNILMHMKICIHYSNRKLLVSFKVLCKSYKILYSMVVNFCVDQIFMDFLS